MSSASEALNEIVAAVQSAASDDPWGDEGAKEHLTHATLALERMRRILEAPVLAAERRVSKTADTIPASEVA